MLEFIVGAFVMLLGVLVGWAIASSDATEKAKDKETAR